VFLYVIRCLEVRVVDPDPHFFELLDLDPGSRRANNDPQKKKKGKNFHVLKCWMFSGSGTGSGSEYESGFPIRTMLDPDLDTH
jgi:hypothetical protein